MLSRNEKYRIVCFAPSRLGGIDLILPILDEINNRSQITSTEIVFLHKKPCDDLIGNSFLFGELKRLKSRIIQTSWFDQTKTKYDLVRSSYQLIACILRLIFSRHPSIVMHSQDGNSRLIAIIHRLNKIRGGTTFEHYSVMHLNILRVADEQKKEVGKQADCFLSFTEDDQRHILVHKNCVLKPIGYPRLFESFIDHVRLVSRQLIKTELVANGCSGDERLIALFLTSTVSGLYEDDELEDWIVSVCKVIRKHDQSAVVFLKPHPTTEVEKLMTIISKLQDDKIFVTSLHQSVLSAEAQFVVSHFTTTLVDAVCMDCPTIYVPHENSTMQNRHGNFISELKKLSYLHADTFDDLDEMICKIKKEDYVKPSLQKVINHTCNISSLYH